MSSENLPAHDWRPKLISPAFDWMAIGGLAAGMACLTFGLVRIRNERQSPFFRIGSDAGVEFPMATAPSASFPLVAPEGDRFVVNFTADMDGEVVHAGQVTSLKEMAARGHAQPSSSAPGALQLALPAQARIKLKSGLNTFLIASVARPKKHAVPLFASRQNRALAFFAGSAIVHLGMVAFLNTLPPSPDSLSLDLGSADARLIRTSSKGVEDAIKDTEPTQEQSSDGGGTGTSMALDSGTMGDKNSDRSEGRFQSKKTDDTPQLSREQAIAQARDVGLVGSIMQAQGGAFASLTAGGNFSAGLDDANIMGGLLGDEAGAMAGGFGFGRSGFGPGGGGTGWGTIGTGNYGTIGGGDGTGTGYSIGPGRNLNRNRTAAVPAVKIGHPTQSSGLDKNIIRRYVRKKIERIKYCYEKQLLVKPGLMGTVQATFQISPQGAVLSSTAQGISSEVSDCVAETLATIHFPKPQNGVLVQVTYPFTFRPTGG